jgi:hypothetical protein
MFRGEKGTAVALPVPGKRDEHRQALQRVEGKQQVIADLIAGRLDLLEAAARFAHLQPGFSDDGERLCRSVIGWAYLALSDRPERAEALTERLEQELAAHLERHGVVRLA